MSTQMDKLLAQQVKAQQKLHQAEMEDKRIKKQIAEVQRNERTHRLCNRGGYIEKLLEELGASDLTDEELFGYLDYALKTPYAKTRLNSILEAKRKEAAEKQAAEAAQAEGNDAGEPIE